MLSGRALLSCIVGAVVGRWWIMAVFGCGVGLRVGFRPRTSADASGVALCDGLPVSDAGFGSVSQQGWQSRRRRRRSVQTVEPRPVEDRTARMQKRFELPVLVAALLVIPSMVLLRSASGSAAWWVAVALNVLIWLVFAAELTAIL
jgi:hypothetical protein